MQNQPTTQPFAPQTVPPPQGQPYQVQPVFQAVPVRRSNGDAVSALIMGIISAIAAFIAILIIANIPYQTSEGTPETGFVPAALVIFLAGSLFALPSIASGHAGLSRSSTDGGALMASTGLTFGYFFWLILTLSELACFSST